MAEPYRIVSLSPLRKVIAARMTEAKRTIPHYRLVADIEMDALLKLREQTNIEQPDRKVSINDYLIKACASALMEHPAVNIQLVEEKIHQYHDTDISVVIAVEGGLATPVVRAANRKSVQEIAEEVKGLSARAVAKQLRMEEILGGSFSLSNLGSFGVDQFDAIINPPQCAILAVGRAKPRTVVSPLGEPCVRTIMRATLSVDHRTIDGATGGKFLTALREVLEQPARLVS